MKVLRKICIFTSPEHFRWLLTIQKKKKIWTWCFDLSRSRVCSTKLLPQGIIHTKWHLHTSNTWAMVIDSGRKTFFLNHQNIIKIKSVGNILVKVSTFLDVWQVDRLIFWDSEVQKTFWSTCRPFGMCDRSIFWGCEVLEIFWSKGWPSGMCDRSTFWGRLV